MCKTSRTGSRGLQREPAPPLSKGETDPKLRRMGRRPVLTEDVIADFQAQASVGRDPIVDAAAKVEARATSTTAATGDVTGVATRCKRYQF